MIIGVIISVIAVAVLSPAVLAAILLFPYASLIFKRKKMLRHLYKTAELCGYRVRPLHKWVSLSKNRDDRYDILIEDTERAYVIKLWSAKKTDSTLIINRDGTFFESSVVPGGLGADDEYIFTGKQQTVPVTRSNFRVKKTKKLELVLLYYPEHKSVYIDLGSKRVPLCEGQKIFGKKVLTPETLEYELRRYRAAAKQETAVAKLSK